MGRQVKTITLTGVSKSYAKPDGGLSVVLDGVDLALRPGHFLSLIGPNGCGKTTLLNIVAGLQSPELGEVKVSGPGHAPLRVGYVWQNYREALLPWLSIEDNIALPIRMRTGSWVSGRLRAGALLSEFLPAISRRARPYQLSGGQLQLASLLRAVASEPDVLLLDEPFSSLDQHQSWKSALFVERLWAERPIPVLFVSHDVDEAVLLADEVLLLSGARHRIVKIVSNHLSRPRSMGQLTEAEHVHCRNEIIQFFRSDSVADGSLRDLRGLEGEAG